MLSRVQWKKHVAAICPNGTLKSLRLCFQQAFVQERVVRDFCLFKGLKTLRLSLYSDARRPCLTSSRDIHNLFREYQKECVSYVHQSHRESANGRFNLSTVKLHKRGPLLQTAGHPFFPATWPAHFCLLVYCPGREPTVCQNRLGHQNYYFWGR